MKSRTQLALPLILLMAGVLSMTPITAHADQGLQRAESHGVQKHKGIEKGDRHRSQKSKQQHARRVKGVERGEQSRNRKSKGVERGERFYVQRRKGMEKPRLRQARNNNNIEKNKQRHVQKVKGIERGDRRHAQRRGAVARSGKHRGHQHRVIENRKAARNYEKLAMYDRGRANRWRSGGPAPYSRYFRGIRVNRPYGYRYPGYGFYYADSDAYRWLAFTAITLAMFDYISEEQQRLHEEAQIRATMAAVGESVIWQDGNASGSVMTTRIGASTSGRQCREFQQTVTIGGRSEQAYGTACLQPDGAWEIM